MTAVRPEKRRDPRIHTELPVFLGNGTGITRDISASGMFFWTDMPHLMPAPGNSISFSVEMSALEAKNTIMKVQGVIIRKEPRGTEFVGVAVRITESTMEPA